MIIGKERGLKSQRTRYWLAVVLLLLCPAMSQAQNGGNTWRDISYIAADDTSALRRECSKLDIYLPERKDGFKTLVWIHGGGLEGGSKDFPRELCGQGFAVVSIDYRLFPKAQCPDYIVDAAEAVAWTVRHIGEYGGDASQVYVGGHSAGGYLTLMLALDKQWLGRYGVDADSIRGYYPISGQTATHYTIRRERGIDQRLPIVDDLAPLNCARKIGTHLMLITGERRLEMMARWEENVYLKAILEGVGNDAITLHELDGFDHGSVVDPACILIANDIKSD